MFLLCVVAAGFSFNTIRISSWAAWVPHNEAVIIWKTQGEEKEEEEGGRNYLYFRGDILAFVLYVTGKSICLVYDQEKGITQSRIIGRQDHWGHLTGDLPWVNILSSYSVLNSWKQYLFRHSHLHRKFLSWNVAQRHIHSFINSQWAPTRNQPYILGKDW